MTTRIVPNGWSSTTEPSRGSRRSSEWFLEEAPVARSKLTTSPRNMILEKFVKVLPGLGLASDVVRDHCDFEPDSLFDRKPVQLDECWLGVIWPRRYRHNYGEFVLNVLQLLNIGPWRSCSSPTEMRPVHERLFWQPQASPIFWCGARHGCESCKILPRSRREEPLKELSQVELRESWLKCRIWCRSQSSAVRFLPMLCKLLSGSEPDGLCLVGV